MPSYTPQNAVQSFMDTQISFMADATQKSLDMVRKVSELNLQFTQDVLGDFFQASRELSSGSPAAISTALTSQSNPLGERVRRYQEALVQVLGGGNIDLARSAPWLLPTAFTPVQSKA